MTSSQYTSPKSHGVVVNSEISERIWVLYGKNVSVGTILEAPVTIPIVRRSENVSSSGSVKEAKTLDEALKEI